MAKTVLDERVMEMRARYLSSGTQTVSFYFPLNFLFICSSTIINIAKT